MSFTLNSTLDVLYLVLAIVAGWVGVFLCWSLYEIAKMLHQANQLVTETREKINRVERAIVTVKEKLESSVGYLGMLAEGGRSVLSLLQTKQGKSAKKRSGRKGKNDDEDEE
jgi:hypothetical protein